MAGLLRRHHERYVTPPLVAHEPASRRWAVWRFRLITLVIVLALALVVAEVTLHFVNTEQSPTASFPGG